MWPEIPHKSIHKYLLRWRYVRRSYLRSHLGQVRTKACHHDHPVLFGPVRNDGVLRADFHSLLYTAILHRGINAGEFFCIQHVFIVRFL